MGVLPFAKMLRLCLFVYLLSLASSVDVKMNATDADIHRAVIQTPRPEYRGAQHLGAANKVLNRHLSNMAHLKTRECESFSADDLQDLLRLLYGASDATLLKVYEEAQDNRRQVYASAAEMESDFKRLNALVKGRSELHDVLRDGLCHRVVMWFVHHLPSKTQHEVAHLGTQVPLL